MYLTSRFYICSALVVALLAMGYALPAFFVAGKVAMVALVVAAAAEAMLLFSLARVSAGRRCADMLSNGDDNPVVVDVENKSPFALRLTVLDEVPPGLLQRDVRLALRLGKGMSGSCQYSLRPVRRGDYGFGVVRVFATTAAGLVSRRFNCGTAANVKVYPSFVELKNMQLLGRQQLDQAGMRKVRRVGHNTDFEHIKDYVKGDDYRHINWKASARRNALMVNVYQEERSQQVLSLIDMGRAMQYVSQGMTLLDHAINASLMVSYVAVSRQDNAGLLTFADQVHDYLPASRQPSQIKRILDCLYNLDTTFGESDYSMLCHTMAKMVRRRSFAMLYTSFTSMSALNRQLPYLRELNRRHRLLVIFFEDSDMDAYAWSSPTSTVEYYRHVVAQRFVYEKRLMVSKLTQNGIYSVLTTPQHLTVDAVNKYLEMKSKNLLV